MTEEENSLDKSLKILIVQDHGIKTKPDASEDPQAKSTKEIIYQLLGHLVRSYNIQETYIDDAEPWM